MLHNPLFVNTGLAQPFRQPTRTVVSVVAKLFATPVDTAILPVTERIDTTGARPVRVRVRRRVDVTGPAFDPDAARRLTGVLRDMIIGSVEV